MKNHLEIGGKGWSFWIGGTILSLIFLSAGHIYWKQWQYNRGFAQIHPGMSRQQVLEKLDTPTQITDCTTTYSGFKRGQSDPAPVGCTQEYWYDSPIFPEGWSYTFDAQGKLIDSYHWVSP
ncbi:MAG: hypothetical protein HY774_19645 [Acidobacteria bacterium]|nr:hypothetical protein [Acidobacteriota bacterium]